MVGHPVRPVVVRRLEDECTQILAQPSHISLPTGVPVRIDRGKVDLESEKRKAALWVRARHVNQDLKLAIAEKMGDMPFNDRREPILDGYTAVSDYNHWARE